MRGSRLATVSFFVSAGLLWGCSSSASDAGAGAGSGAGAASGAGGAAAAAGASGAAAAGQPAAGGAPSTLPRATGAHASTYVLVTLRSDVTMVGQDPGNPEPTGIPSNPTNTPDKAQFPTGTDAVYVALVDTFAHDNFVLFGITNEAGGNRASP